MKNYEKLIALINERDGKVKSIYDEYIGKFKDFECQFSKERIEELGWLKVGFYAPGNEYIYEKNGKKIAVYINSDYSRILLRGNMPEAYQIHDYEHLEDYANGLAYKDVEFYAYY